MVRTILVWALVLAAGAFALQWLEYQYVARRFSWEVYVGLIGAALLRNPKILPARSRPATA